MRLNIAKTRVLLHSRKTIVLSYEYQICHAIITNTRCIKDLGVLSLLLLVVEVVVVVVVVVVGKAEGKETAMKTKT
jgi:hypothetical protein